MKDHCFRSNGNSDGAPFWLAVVGSDHVLEHCDLLCAVGLAACCLILSPYLMVDHLNAEQGMAEEVAHIGICGDSGIRGLHLNEFSDIVKCCAADQKLAVKERIHLEAALTIL